MTPSSSRERRRRAYLQKEDRSMRSRIAIAALTLIASVLVSFAAHAADKVIRIGFQEYGNLVLLKGKGDLERRLAPLGFQVAWTEFPAGPPLLEAINAGAIDFGSVGEAPPIFAQAAGTPFVYVAHEPPAPKGEAILVPKDSKITSVSDLKGKRVALNKGSNVHYLLVRALEAKDNTKAVAQELSPSIGIPAPILEVALARQTYGVKPLDAQVVAEQQRIADAFHALGLIPKPIVVATQVRRTGS
jgi:ABC-type nitrate/sulfonate/bicarbonate transport system substrate-binding protein